MQDVGIGDILGIEHIDVRHVVLSYLLFRSLSGSPHPSAIGSAFLLDFFSLTEDCEPIPENFRGFSMATLTLTEKLDQLGTRYDELTQELSSAEIVSDSSRFQKVAKQQSELGEIVAKHREFKQIEKDLAGAHQMFLEAEDAEMKQMAHDEEKELSARKEVAERELKLLLLPKDPLDEKSVIVEIRAGTGGDEAALFAAELFRMYSRYAETQGWKVEILESSPSSIGGLKEVVAAIQGQKVYSKLKYESGVHRVQRVPATETQGRIHTSAATVAVLPEADDIDIKIEAKDLRIDTFCSSGPGGQSVNTTYSAVRITHLPSGLVVSQQDEKSQIKNRAKAMRVLRARLYEMEQQKQHDAIAAERRGQIKTGDRSEKIRTYNFPQNRVSDHRIGLTVHQLDAVMEGKLAPFVESLVTHFEAERLKQELVEAYLSPSLRWFPPCKSLAGHELRVAPIRSATRDAITQLEREHIPSAPLAAELLLMHTLERDRTWLYSHPEQELDAATRERYFSLIAQRASGVPTQHLTGHQEFWGLDFEVTPDVLIPRPETEHVVEVALDRLGVRAGGAASLRDAAL